MSLDLVGKGLELCCKMLKTYQIKTQCNGDLHSSKTANILLPGLVIKYRWTPLYVQNCI